MIREGDTVKIKEGHSLEVGGEDVTGQNFKVHSLYKDIDLAIVLYGDELVKVPIELLEKVEKPEADKPDIEVDVQPGEIIINDDIFHAAILTVCTPDYIREHVSNADELDLDFGIVAASGAVVACMLWDYLRVDI